MKLKHQILNRIISRLDRSAGREECWYYNGCHDPQGRPVDQTLARTYGLSVSVYRTLMMVMGKLDIDAPRSVQVMHKCDHPGCCNPRHLEVGDAFKNMRQCVERKRNGRGWTRMSPEAKMDVLRSFAFGEPVSSIAARHGKTTGAVHKQLRRAGVTHVRHRQARVTPEIRARITADRLQGDTLMAIGKRYGVNHVTVFQITRHLQVNTKDVIDRKAVIRAEMKG